MPYDKYPEKSAKKFYHTEKRPYPNLSHLHFGPVKSLGPSPGPNWPIQKISGNNAKRANPPSLIPSEIWTSSFIRENRDFHGHGQKFIIFLEGSNKIIYDTSHSSFYRLPLNPFLGVKDTRDL
jgi:hypothetical protein